MKATVMVLIEPQGETRFNRYENVNCIASQRIQKKINVTILIDKTVSFKVLSL